MQFYQTALETVMVRIYQYADCSLRKKFIVSFIIIFGALSFPLYNTLLCRSVRQSSSRENVDKAIADIRLSTLCCPWWVSLSRRCGIKSPMLPPVESL